MKVVDTLRSTMRFRRFELDANKRRLNKVASVEDLRRIARRRLPRGIFDYIDGGAEDERTLARNSEAFARIEFRPRVLREVGDGDPSTTLLGRPLPYPLVLAPTGYTRIADPQGELAVARAAERAGLPYSLSTMATRSIEEVAAVSNGRKWFQVYTFRDRGSVKDMISRAAEAGYEAIMPTVDLAVLGQRDRDVRRGFTMPPKLGLGTLLDGATHPGWTWAFARSEPIKFANIAQHGVGGRRQRAGLDGRLRQHEVRPQPVVARHRVDALDLERADGDQGHPVRRRRRPRRRARCRGHRPVEPRRPPARRAPTPVDLVAPVVDAVGDRLEVICDGGVRRGSDIVKAVALGARACMAGRAYLYALGAAGELGVDHVLKMLDSDVRRTMALIGARTIADITPEMVAVPSAG